LEVLEGSEGVRDGAGEVVAGEVEVAEVGEERECGGEGTSEEVLAKVEVAERAAEGDVEREGLVDGVVEEVDGEEVGETTEDVGEEWASDVGVGEVQFRYGGVGSIAGAGYPKPVARGGVPGVPGGESGERVVERELELVQVQPLLVQTRHPRYYRKQNTSYYRKWLGHSCLASPTQCGVVSVGVE